jgi:hypothetical protein
MKLSDSWEAKSHSSGHIFCVYQRIYTCIIALTRAQRSLYRVRSKLHVELRSILISEARNWKTARSLFVTPYSKHSLFFSYLADAPCCGDKSHTPCTHRDIETSTMTTHFQLHGVNDTIPWEGNINITNAVRDVNAGTAMTKLTLPVPVLSTQIIET